MKTIIREGGTPCYFPELANDRICAIRSVLTGGTAKVDGVLIDLTTAGAIVAVYDVLNETNKDRFASLPSYKMATVAWKLVK